MKRTVLDPSGYPDLAAGIEAFELEMLTGRTTWLTVHHKRFTRTAPDALANEWVDFRKLQHLRKIPSSWIHNAAWIHTVLDALHEREKTIPIPRFYLLRSPA